MKTNAHYNVYKMHTYNVYKLRDVYKLSKTDFNTHMVKTNTI